MKDGWWTVSFGPLSMNEDRCYLRVVDVHKDPEKQTGYVKLEDGKTYLCDYDGILPGQIVLACVPWDGIGYVAPA